MIIQHPNHLKHILNHPKLQIQQVISLEVKFITKQMII